MEIITDYAILYLLEYISITNNISSLIATALAGSSAGYKSVKQGQTPSPSIVIDSV